MLTAGDIFCEYASHDDLVDFIIWNGKDTVENFLENVSSALILASTMTKDPGFDGDVNILQRLIF